MTHEGMSAVANHIWQSTLFGLCAIALSLMLRRAPGSLRFRLWMMASLKFLVPFALLESMGEWLASASKAAAAATPVTRLYPVDVIDKPFTFASVLSSSADVPEVHHTLHLGDRLPSVFMAVWCAGTLFFLLRWVIQWRRVRTLVAAALPAPLGDEVAASVQILSDGPGNRPVEVLLSDHVCEPGIFGILHPKLVWPRGLSEKLSGGEIEAVIAHELCHVRRRDNLTMTLHMLVQTLFWFHPLLWWLRARLIDAREHACDEAVVDSGFASEVYAAGILRACEASLEGPAACMAGMSGSDLCERIHRIVSDSTVRRVTRAATLGLTGFMAMTLATPVLLGRFNTPAVHAALIPEQNGNPKYAFEVATIKPSDPKADGSSMLMNGTSFNAQNMPLFNVVAFAYDARSDSQVIGAPDWVKNVRFDIHAKEDPATAEALQKLSPEESRKQIELMLQALLAERCHLKIVRETGERPVYALVVKTGGILLKASDTASLPEHSAQNEPKLMQHGIRMNGQGNLQGMSVSTEILADVLAHMPEAEGRPVIDRTGLTGNYDFTLKWTPDMPGPGGPPPDSSGPTLFTALQEQLGLKLEPQKGTVEVLRIESIERPGEN
jgi:bla regulator protein blaR1